LKTRAPREAIGKTLAEPEVRSKYGITIVGINLQVDVQFERQGEQ
jgi:K+/H+ antiporter YhaU regulatory subunit KhtT